jgi:hypothetical protein
VGEGQLFFNASIDRVTVLDNFQVLELAARFFRCPTANAVDRIYLVAAHLDGRYKPRQVGFAQWSLGKSFRAAQLRSSDCYRR